MKKLEKATAEIFHFNCKDIITTSPDHDNGYVDVGDLERKLEAIVDKVEKIFK